MQEMERGDCERMGMGGARLVLGTKMYCIVLYSPLGAENLEEV